jgi:anthranilate synthase component 1
MIRPEYKEFCRLARQKTLIPVVKSVMADVLTPVSAFLAIAGGEPYAFLLESVERGERIGRYTFLGSRPYMRVEARDDKIQLHYGKKVASRQGNPLPLLKDLLRQHRPGSEHQGEAGSDGDARGKFHSGLLLLFATNRITARVGRSRTRVAAS